MIKQEAKPSIYR